MSKETDYLYLYGKRVEKLLLLGILLICISLFHLLLSKAALHYRKAFALKTFATLIEKQKPELESAFENKTESIFYTVKYIDIGKKVEDQTGFSQNELWKLVAPAPSPTGEPPLIDETMTPGEIVEKLHKKEAELGSDTATVYGIEIPYSVYVNYGGINIKVNTWRLNWMASGIIVLMSILWMQTFGISRKNELIHISKLPSYENSFPHFLNTFPIINCQKKTNETNNLGFEGMRNVFFALKRPAVVSIIPLILAGLNIEVMRLTFTAETYQLVFLATVFFLYPVYSIIRISRIFSRHSGAKSPASKISSKLP